MLCLPLKSDFFKFFILWTTKPSWLEDNKKQKSASWELLFVLLSKIEYGIEKRSRKRWYSSNYSELNDIC
ncbi:hypothetical protein BN1224_CV14_A_08690 [Chlamydia pneumoniae]|uniref:Uncharacterized protein n=1 Tax=Chlamydia pneumoniae TaxID=83558 RepID=A0A0F7XIP0_CHLPN|nr:hypothetical protein BN1224_Wien1_A_08670 [Chlamydia pneumoniae]CRI36223.1 hypothetical protein BN1224_CM1_A_08700 [Chlamydia pneumoniae]CRI37350.1 hypothetical protein BN1224_CV14_A_08690 [Chlamydia pneumoniae]CRI38479.1 hypothetical protein BN1224_CV15_C_03120 [Chlamydia pneumoniae]CRI39611.1 hypothetical protein BN1224_CWL011_A_08750 [Chlamydia pneumoniae]